MRQSKHLEARSREVGDDHVPRRLEGRLALAVSRPRPKEAVQEVGAHVQVRGVRHQLRGGCSRWVVGWVVGVRGGDGDGKNAGRVQRGGRVGFAAGRKGERGA